MIYILNAPTLRQLIKQANEMSLTKKEIVAVQHSQDQYFMVYCKE